LFGTAAATMDIRSAFVDFGVLLYAVLLCVVDTSLLLLQYTAG